MEISSQTQSQINPYLQNANTSAVESAKNAPKREVPEDVKKIINDSSFRVTLSMNAQIVLEAAKQSEKNYSAQANLLNFLNGKQTQDGYSLADIGYTGKPIADLSTKEADKLLGDDGFFGVTQTSQRVANFVLGFAGDDLKILEEGRKGIVQGFEDANKLFGGKLPEISHQTQEKTLALIDEKIAELKAAQNIKA